MNSEKNQEPNFYYKDMKIQPIEYILTNNLNFLEGCIVKRISRYISKKDPIKDLEKIKYEVDLLIESIKSKKDI